MALTARALFLFPLLSVALSSQSFVTYVGPGADRLFRQSRNAVGGEASVSGITSLVMKGTVKVSVNDGGPRERAIELRMLLPGNYLRTETGGEWARKSGYSGGTLLTEIRKGATIDKPPAQMTPALLHAEKARLARLLLGIASLTSPDVWLSIKQPGDNTEVGSAIGRVLEATNVNEEFLTQVYYDSRSVPLRVEYEGGGRRIVIAFSDRKKVGDLLLPHRIKTTVDGNELEEIRLDEIAVNTALTKADFGG
jgi:hypothetical protein